MNEHDRGDESVSDTIDRLLHAIDSDWRPNPGFLAGEKTAALGTEADRGLASLTHSSDELGRTVNDFDPEQ